AGTTTIPVDGAAQLALTLMVDVFHNRLGEMARPPAPSSCRGTKPTMISSANPQANGYSQALADQRLTLPEERVPMLHRLLGEPACRKLGIFPIPAGFTLSVVIPVYNEEQWIGELVKRVQAVPIPKEIILVDDCSKDVTRAILKELEGGNVRVFYQPVNKGKGAALREGFRHATGDVVVVQDADLEYDPSEYPRLIQPILENRADVVYGSRFIGESPPGPYFWPHVPHKPPPSPTHPRR